MFFKHKAKSSVRKHIGDISVCPTCGSDFRSRARLIRHLLDKRVRSSRRSVSCQHAFLQSNPCTIPDHEYKRLEARDLMHARKHRKLGYQQEPASIPCSRAKRRKASPKEHKGISSTGDGVNDAPRPNKRLWHKTSCTQLVADTVIRPSKRLRTKTPPAVAYS